MEQKVFDTSRLRSTYFAQALPVVLGSVVSLIYNLADTYFIAQTGDALLVAGVSLCSPVFILLMAFGNIYAQGGSSLISRLLGKNDRAGVRRVSAFCFYAAILTGLLLAAPMLLFHRPLLTLLGASGQTLPYAMPYYCILAAGAPLVVLNFIHANLLRCEGQATLSMLGTSGGAVLNIILDPIFISLFGWGAAGAAIATLCGYLFTNLFLLVVVLRRSSCLSVDCRRAHISGDSLRQILGIGVTAAIANLAQSASLILMNQFLLPYGSEKIAALGIVLKINMVVQMVLVGFSFGGVPLFGYLYGAKDFQKLHKLLRFCLRFLCSLALGISALLFLLAPQLVRLFIDSGSIVSDGAAMLRWQTAGSPFAAVVLLLTCLFQAAGKALPALLLSLSRQGVIFIAVLAAAVFIAQYQGFLAAQLTADLLSAALALLLYRRAFGRGGGEAAG
ncbi:MAG: MATE family efflux transporter [Provencibacterium sp.]|jgi:multidrug efflux pump|nr:MATE family efflux transporter [Provencibacterium sp.]